MIQEVSSHPKTPTFNDPCNVSFATEGDIHTDPRDRAWTSLGSAYHRWDSILYPIVLTTTLNTGSAQGACNLARDRQGHGKHARLRLESTLFSCLLILSLTRNVDSTKARVPMLCAQMDLIRAALTRRPAAALEPGDVISLMRCCRKHHTWGLPNHSERGKIRLKILRLITCWSCIPDLWG